MTGSLLDSPLRPAAGVAELADAHGSGPCWLRLVWVQVPPPAPQKSRCIPTRCVAPRSRSCSYASLVVALRVGRLSFFVIAAGCGPQEEALRR